MNGRDLAAGMIVGLGRIGFGFNLDAKRRETWTHERAFALSSSVKLVAAVDPDEGARRRFSAARPGIPVYRTVSEALRHRPLIASICTPTPTHEALARQCLDNGVQAVFCEKPLASTTAQARRILEACRKKRAVLAVNHTRRWDPAYLCAADAVRLGRIGEVLSISARYSGHIYNVGTHLIDAIRMISGLDPLQAIGRAPDPGSADPHVSGMLVLDRDVPCAISCHGRPTDLLFEIDVVGSEGRIRVVENGRRILLERFKTSANYGGYREPAAVPIRAPRKTDRFVEAVRDISDCMNGSGRKPKCSGEDGFWALAAAEALTKSARVGGRPLQADRPG